MSAPQLFDLPSVIGSGTTLQYTRSNADYPASQGWSLILVLKGAVRVASANATASGDSFVVTVPASSAGSENSTDEMTPGVYRATERYTHATFGTYDVAAGYLTVTPNLATAGGAQIPEEAELNLVNARILERLAAGHDLESYHADSFGVVKVTLQDLYNLRQRLQEKLRSIATGGQFSRQVLVTFPGTGLRS